MKLRRYIYTVLPIAATLSLSSCLDENPIYTENNEIVFADEDNIQLALNGCYAYFTSTNSYGQNLQEMNISLGGFTWGQRNGSDQDLFCSLNPTSSIGQVGTWWDGEYKVISEVNAFIENVESCSLDDDVKNNFINEAKFLRALAYLNLTTMFGDVPLKTTASTSDGIATPRSPQEDIFAQIISDLEDATNMSRTDMEDGYACTWTAKAYLGKVYHKMAALGINSDENWQNAKTYFDDVYNNGPFSLQADFNDLFGTWVTGSSEAIFQLNFYSVASSGYYNRGSNRLCPQASTTGINWTTFAVSYSAYDLHWGTYPGDPRIQTTFLTQWRDYGSNSQSSPLTQVGAEPSPNDSVYAYPYIVYTVAGDSILDSSGNAVELKDYVVKIPNEEMPDPTNPSLDYLENYPYPENATSNDSARVEALRKSRSYFAEGGNAKRFTSHGKAFDQYQSAQAANKNLMVFRYGEMLLLMADVYNELGYTSQAISLANEVLARARNSNGGTLTGEPADWSSSLSQEEVRKKLYYERIFELWGEPDIWDMIRIRGKEYLKEALSYHNNHEMVIASDTYYNESNNNYTERLYNGGDLTDEFLTKILLLPIPTSETDANPAITDNNYGY